MYKEFIETNAVNREVFTVLVDHGGVGPYDVWNRTGVMTLILRQKIIESLTGEKFSETPWSLDEQKWFTDLMNNQKFRSYYDGIDWDSPQMKEMYSEIKQEIIKPPILLASAE